MRIRLLIEAEVSDEDVALIAEMVANPPACRLEVDDNSFPGRVVGAQQVHA